MANILIIDDDAYVRDVLVQVIGGAGHSTQVAGDGDKGLELYRAGKPDLVVTDIMMPGKDGMETIRELRAFDPNARIIAMSGGGRIRYTQVLEFARKLGADDAIAKPFSNAELLSRIAALLGR